MKKIIAISVMLALVAGAVFADTTVGGAVETRFSLAKQTANKNAAGETPDPVMGGTIGAAQIVLTGSNGDGTLGGRFRYKHTAWQIPSNGQNYDQVFVWWKPIEQVKIFLGIDQDGLFDTADIVGWSFHAGDNDYLFNHHWDFWRQIFPGNWDGFGLAFSFYPIPGLDINLALPTGKVGWRQAPVDDVQATRPITNSTDAAGNSNYDGMLPGRLRFVANYSLDFGKISFVYLGGTVAVEKGVAYMTPGSIDKDNNGIVGLSALITAIDSIQIKVGGSAFLNTDSDMLINAGLGVVWNGDGFGVKVRAGLVMQGDNDMFITGNIMPFFAVGEKGQVLVDIGVTTVGDSMGWFVTPAYRLGIEGGAFKIGLQVYNNVKVDEGGNIGITNQEYIKWNIPMLLSFNF